MTNCTHKHGDHIAPMNYWVCGQCFSILEKRPQRYGVVATDKRGTEGVRARQEVVWQADILKSGEGTTLSVFLKAMVKRFRHRDKDMRLSDAYSYAIGVLRGHEVPFGHVDHDWSRGTAIDIADEEMCYWDGDHSEGNG